MRYRLSLPEPHSHLFHVEVVADGPGDVLELVFPVWTPGSYLVREFARHVEGLVAEDGAGRPLPLERLDKHRLLVRAGGAERAVVRYRVYANELTVRTAHLDGTHGFLNPAALFPYARGRERERHVVHILPPPGWHVSTALEGGPTEFAARDYDELADSPVEIGTHRTLRFTALGKPHEVALWGRGNLDEIRFADDARKVVEALGTLMGGLPYARYLFVVHLADKRRGGLEHASSTTLHAARAGRAPRAAALARVARAGAHEPRADPRRREDEPRGGELPRVGEALPAGREHPEQRGLVLPEGRARRARARPRAAARGALARRPPASAPRAVRGARRAGGRRRGRRRGAPRQGAGAPVLRPVRPRYGAARARARRRRAAPPAARHRGVRRQGRDRAEGGRRRAASGVPRRGAHARTEARRAVGSRGEPGAPRGALRGGRARGGGRLPGGPRRA